MIVLIVEDAASVAETLKTFVTMSGHMAFIANRAEQALELTATVQFDLVLLDLNLPGMDGFELATRLRQSHLRPAALIVAVTSLADDPEKRRAHGIGGYLAKPLSMSRLQALLDGLTLHRGHK